MPRAGQLIESDAALVEAARRGNKDAFCLLLTRHRPLLIALCRRFLRDDGLVEEASQEAILQAMLNLTRLRRPNQFGSWLAGIGLNICRQIRRDRARCCWSWDQLVGGRIVPEPLEQRPGPAELAEAADLAEQVRRAVAILPAGQRAAVVLAYLSGLTQAETATVLGIEPGAVKTRLYKGRSALRRTLMAWKEEPMTTTQDLRPVEVRISDVRRASASDDGPAFYIALLKEKNGARRLAIWMGEFEGKAIAVHLEKVQVPRPLTFSFMAGLLEAGGLALREVRINRLDGDTFYAVASVEGPEGVRTVDARPSDALALALVTGAAISVEPEVFDAQAAFLEAHPLEAAAEEAQGAREIVAEMKATWARQAAASSEARK